MAKLYKGNLTLNWYNKQKAILLQDEQNVRTNDVPAPNINWINKDEALFYEINEQEGKGVTPYWVDRTDIRIKESRSLKFRKAFKANYVDKSGGVPGLSQELETEELEEDDSTIENMLIKGDNLLVLNTLKKMYYNKPDEDKIKCIYIDPPYNSGNAFIDYDDNMQHSQWLTMMRDRIELLYQLLKNDGFLFIQIDDKECAYLTILIHEIFGRENCKVVAVKMAEPTGLKMASVIKKGSIPKLKEYIIIAGKNGISGLDIERIPKEKWDNEYKTYLSNISKEEVNILKEIRENEERTEEDIELADEILSKIQTCRLSEQYLLNRIENEEDKNIFNYENAWRIIRITSISGNAKFLADKKRNDNNNKFFSIVTPQKKMYFIKNNYDITQNEPRIKVLFADDYLTTHPGDFWQDIKTTGLDNEGNVELKQSKKPEKLVYRIIKMATNEGDWVLDCFAGSGTTLSVAHKMRRKWIGIEIGKHAETKILPRLKNVLSNHDQSPIIKLTHWQGGGSFKYYHLGESIIKLKADGTGDFNWALGKEEIQESFLSSYDYVIDKTIDFQEEQLFQDKENQPLVGYQTVGTKKAVAVITLNEPSGYMEAISYEEIQQIYKKVKKEHNPEYTTIFTNRGVEIAYDSKPPDLEIVKIPHAIFAELER